MKKTTIWILGVIMGFSFLSLLYLQVSYIEEMVKMRKEQFDESVKRSLYQAARNLELNETLRYLEKDVAETERASLLAQSTSQQEYSDVVHQTHKYSVMSRDGSVYSSFELKTITKRPSDLPKAMISKNPSKSSIPEASRSLQEIIKSRYVYQRALLDEVVYNILYTASEKPLEDRVNFKLLDQDIKSELLNNGIDLPYHFTVSTNDGREVYRCPDYEEKGEEYAFPQILFRNDPPAKMGLLKVHFPTMDNYIFSSVRFMIPSLIFTFVLLVTFIFTIFVIFRQKKLTEIKNDFINNMTHEFKTPLASILIASNYANTQKEIIDNPKLSKYMQIIINQSNKLNQHIEKILYVAKTESKQIELEKSKVDLKVLLELVRENIFLKHQKEINIDIQLDRNYSIQADEFHFYNVIYNILDNAVKYAPQTPKISIQSKENSKGLTLKFTDNGCGIPESDLPFVFDKFYRVAREDSKDIEGFGIGLSYVKRVCEWHKWKVEAKNNEEKGITITIQINKNDYE